MNAANQFKIIRALRAANVFAAIILGGCETARAQETEQPAVQLSGSYTGEIWNTVQGGTNPGSTYLDNLELAADIDLERVAGFKSASARFSLLRNNSASFSDLRVGDFQVISNIDTDGSMRLFEAWVDQQLGPLSLRAGLQDVNSEFDINETGALFINSSHGIGPEISQIGPNGPGIFPISALGARAAVAIGKSADVKFGIFEGIPGSLDHPKRTVLRIDNNEGQMIIAQADYRPLPALRVSSGVWHRSGRNGPQPLDKSTTKGAYALVESQIARLGSGSVSAFIRSGTAAGSELTIGHYWGAGAVYVGPLLGNPARDERIGLAIASAFAREGYRQEMEALGVATAQSEIVFELTYQIRMSPWLTIQPNAQYVINPAFERDRHSVVATGIRVQLEWTGGN